MIDADEYGQFEAVNGGIVNNARRKITALESERDALIKALKRIAATSTEYRIAALAVDAVESEGRV